ncbi:MAG: hypothetical protein WA671_05600, partial [Candidatus Sulfotelmatobacter sp.]
MKTKALGRHDLASMDRHCLDHDRAVQIGVTRLDVTMQLWKADWRTAIVRTSLPPHPQRIRHPINVVKP